MPGDSHAAILMLDLKTWNLFKLFIFLLVRFCLVVFDIALGGSFNVVLSEGVS